jgi:hypothetical protein
LLPLTPSISSHYATTFRQKQESKIDLYSEGEIKVERENGSEKQPESKGIERIKELIKNDRRIELEKESKNILINCYSCMSTQYLLKEIATPLISQLKAEKIIDDSFSLKEYATLLEPSQDTQWTPNVKIQIPMQYIDKINNFESNPILEPVRSLLSK